MTQFTLFVMVPIRRDVPRNGADLPRCSMVVAVSRALRELPEPCFDWTREAGGQAKSLVAHRQDS